MLQIQKQSTLIFIHDSHNVNLTLYSFVRRKFWSEKGYNRRTVSHGYVQSYQQRMQCLCYLMCRSGEYKAD